MTTANEKVKTEKDVQGEGIRELEKRRYLEATTDIRKQFEKEMMNKINRTTTIYTTLYYQFFTGKGYPKIQK